MPVACAAPAANVNDTLVFERLFLAAFAVMARIRTVFADKGYDAGRHRDLCRAFGAKPASTNAVGPAGQAWASGAGRSSAVSLECWTTLWSPEGAAGAPQHPASETAERGRGQSDWSAQAQTAAAAEIGGRVVGIADGDTLTVLDDGRRQTRVRLAEIDTPEAGQPYGTRARQILSELVFDRAVRVVVQDTDRYGRAVGRVYAGPVDVNAEMVRRGSAWVYRRYSRDPALLALEEEARNAKRGLWALPEAERIPPWEWRAVSPAAQWSGMAPPQSLPQSPARSPALSLARPAPEAAGSADATAGFACSASKRSCRDMGSCEEARFHLSRCGLPHLDRDGDGVPCETLCRR